MSQVNHDSSSSSTPSPGQPSIFSADVRSPTVASSFSQADTVLTSRTHYTANTGGRARQSWRNGINGFWRTPSFLSTENSRSAARRSNSIAGDGTEKAISPMSDAPLIDGPAIELPASLTEKAMGSLFSVGRVAFEPKDRNSLSTPRTPAVTAFESMVPLSALLQ